MSYGPVDPNSLPNNQPNQPNNQPYQPGQPSDQPDSPYTPNQGTPYTPAGQNPVQNQPAYGQVPAGQDQNVWGGNSNGGQPYGQGPQEPNQSPLKWILIAVAVLVLAVGGFFGVRALTGGDDKPDPKPTASATTTPKPDKTTDPAPEETTVPEPEETTDPEEDFDSGSGWVGDVYVYESLFGYRVEFPGEPSVQELDDPMGGEVPMEIVVWESGDEIYQAAFGPQRAAGLTPESSVIGSAEGIGGTATNLESVNVANAEAMTGESEYMGQQVWLLNALSLNDDSVYMLLHSGATRDNAFFDSLEILY